MDKTDTNNTYFTLDETIKKLGVTKQTIYSWTKSGKLEAIGRNRYDVNKYLETLKQEATKKREELSRKKEAIDENQIATINTFIVEDEKTGQLIFKSDLTNSKELRIFGTCDEPLFIAKDTAEMLGYKNTMEAIRDHIDEDDKITYEEYKVKGESVILSPFTLQDSTILITESGLYSLILRSKLKKAKEFKRWITKDVLPSIRKKGQYVLEEYKKQLEEKDRQLTLKNTVIKGLTSDKERIKRTHIHLAQLHDKLLKKRNYYKFKQSPCWYIISDSWRTPTVPKDTKWKMGISNDINARLGQYRTDMPECKIHYLLYVTKNQLLEECMLAKYEKNLTNNNHEYVSGILLENLIQSAEGILKNLEIESTSEKNLHKYNEFYDNIILEVEAVEESEDEFDENNEVYQPVESKEVLQPVESKEVPQPVEESKEVVEDEESIADPQEPSNTDKFICTTCDKSFTYEIYFHKHNLKEHNIPIPVVNERECPVCHKILANKGKVQRHIKSVHDKSTQATCEECDATFSTKDILVAHIKIVHTKESAVECPECQKMLTTKANLERHLEQFHDKVKVECPVCHAMVGRTNLKSHNEIVHLRSGASDCDLCGKKLLTKNGLKYHMFSEHKIVI